MKKAMQFLSLAVVLSLAPALSQASTPTAASTTLAVRLPEYQAGLQAGHAYRDTHTAAEIADERIFAQGQFDAALAIPDRQETAYWGGYLAGLN